MVTSPIAGGGFVLCGVAGHARLEVCPASGILVLQEVLVASLAELYLADLIPLLAEHDVFLRVSGWCFLRFVESCNQFAPIFNFSVRGSFESYWHAHNNAARKQNYQEEISL